MEERLSDVRFVTRHYLALQGWRNVPTGLVLLGAGALLLLLPPEVAAGEEARRRLVLVGAVLTLGLLGAGQLAAGRAYARAFGEAQPTLAARAWTLLASLLAGLLAVASLFTMRGAHAPTPALLGLLAGLLLWSWLGTGRRLHHHLVAALAAAAWAALEAGGVAPLAGLEALGISPVRRSWASLALAWGAAITATALLDHRVLRAHLRPTLEGASS